MTWSMTFFSDTNEVFCIVFGNAFNLKQQKGNSTLFFGPVTPSQRIKLNPIKDLSCCPPVRSGKLGAKKQMICFEQTAVRRLRKVKCNRELLKCQAD